MIRLNQKGTHIINYVDDRHHTGLTLDKDRLRKATKKTVNFFDVLVYWLENPDMYRETMRLVDEKTIKASAENSPEKIDQAHSITAENILSDVEREQKEKGEQNVSGDNKGNETQ